MVLMHVIVVEQYHKRKQAFQILPNGVDVGIEVWLVGEETS